MVPLPRGGDVAHSSFVRKAVSQQKRASGDLGLKNSRLVDERSLSYLPPTLPLMPGCLHLSHPHESVSEAFFRASPVSTRHSGATGVVSLF